MKRYFIDTCVLKWLLEKNKRVKDINYDIDFYQGNYAISMLNIKNEQTATHEALNLPQELQLTKI